MRYKVVLLFVLFAGLLFCNESYSQKKKQGKNQKTINITPEEMIFEPDTSNKLKKPLVQDSSEYYMREAYIKVTAMKRADSVVIRWAVDSPGGWISANKLGFFVQRIEITSNSAQQNPKVYLHASPIKPWTLDEWKAKSKPTDKYSAIAAQCLYGKTASKDFSKSETEVQFASGLRHAAMELSNRYGFAMFAADMSPHAATGLGLRFVDKSFEKDKSYIYIVSVANVDSSYTIHEGIVTVGALQNDKLNQAPSGLKAISGDTWIRLEWDYPEKSMFSAFNVYKYDGNIKKLLNKNPIVPFEMDKDKNSQNPIIISSYVDSNLTNYKKYKYCLTGINEFGEESECAEIEGISKDLTPPIAPLPKLKQISAREVEITWENNPKNKDLAGYTISKSNDYETNFKPLHENILSPNNTRFIDENAKESEPYYIITCIDTAGNISNSIPIGAVIIDSTAPAKPIGLSGAIDSNGIVVLWWNLGNEDNLAGYRVLWANAPNHEFTQIATDIVRDTVFIDSISINTLSRRAYYRVVAVNKRQIASEASDILAIVRPDLYPPQAAVFTEFAVNDSSIHLKWEHSRSKDVSNQILYRRISGESSWNKLKDLSINESEYIDSDILSNTDYEYSIETIDSSGLKSLTEDYLGVKSINLKNKSDYNFDVKYNKNDKSLKIKWLSNSNCNDNIYIYKVSDSNNMILMSKQKCNEEEYLENNIDTNVETMNYLIRVIRGNKVEFETSRKIELNN